MLELDASISRSEPPVNAHFSPIAFGLPGGDLASQLCLRTDAAVQTLPREDREFDLGHVQPTAMLRRVVEFQLLHQTSRLGWLKDVIKDRWCMGIEGIKKQNNIN